jgi:hypothetical protein
MKKILFFLLIATSCFAQKKLRTLELSDTINSFTIDRAGDLYAITRYGQFQKFNKDGDLILLTKNQKNAPTFFDPRDGAKLFAYYRGIQNYDYLNPSFEVKSSFKIDPAFAIQPWLMCTSGDTKLWVLDAADHSLKKLNPKDSVVEVEVVIDASIIHYAQDFTRMKEYQNFVFLLNPHKGIFIFNGLGKHIKTIESHSIRNFHFLGEELYYNSGHRVYFFNLYTAEIRELLLNDPKKINLENTKGDIMMTDERLYVVHPISVDVYELRF